VICVDFTEALEKVSITPSAYVVVVTRGHRYDQECLAAVVGKPAAYIGMIGSRRRVRAIMEWLSDKGVPSEVLERVHSPIGLDIGAETPEEIALSIVAEMVKVKRRGKVPSLKDKYGFAAMAAERKD